MWTQRDVSETSSVSLSLYLLFPLYWGPPFEMRGKDETFPVPNVNEVVVCVSLPRVASQTRVPDVLCLLHLSSFVPLSFPTPFGSP